MMVKSLRFATMEARDRPTDADAMQVEAPANQRKMTIMGQRPHNDPTKPLCTTIDHEWSPFPEIRRKRRGSQKQVCARVEGQSVFQQPLTKSVREQGEVRFALARENDPPRNYGYHGFNGPIPTGRHR